MNRDEMLRLFEAHREAEAAHDVDAILATFVDDCFLETMALGLRAEGRDAVKAAYEAQYFVAFPDLDPDDQGMAFGDDIMVVWGFLQRRPDGRRGDLLRPRDALRAGRAEHRRGPRSRQSKGLAKAQTVTALRATRAA
jgi:hypothetical protein